MLFDIDIAEARWLHKLDPEWWSHRTVAKRLGVSSRYAGMILNNTCRLLPRENAPLGCWIIEEAGRQRALRVLADRGHAEWEEELEALRLAWEEDEL